MRIAMTILAVSLAVAGCKKKTTEPAPTTGSSAGSSMATGPAAGSDTGSAAGSAAGSDMGSAMGSDSGSAAMAGSGAGSGSGSDEQPMAHAAGNCPSTVLGASTKAAVKGKAVVVTISSKDADAIKAIQ